MRRDDFALAPRLVEDEDEVSLNGQYHVDEEEMLAIDICYLEESRVYKCCQRKTKEYEQHADEGQEKRAHVDGKIDEDKDERAYGKAGI